MKIVFRFVLSFVAALCACGTRRRAGHHRFTRRQSPERAPGGVAGASVIAIHLPSGTTYETTTRADGRFQIINMRVGGPYSVTVAYTGAGGAAFAPETQENIEVQPRRRHRPRTST